MCPVIVVIVSYKYQLSQSIILQQILCVFTDHCLIVLANAEKGVLKPQAMILELFISLFSSVTFYIMYFVRHINIFDCYVF